MQVRRCINSDRSLHSEIYWTSVTTTVTIKLAVVETYQYGPSNTNPTPKITSMPASITVLLYARFHKTSFRAARRNHSFVIQGFADSASTAQ